CPARYTGPRLWYCPLGELAKALPEGVSRREGVRRVGPGETARGATTRNEPRAPPPPTERPATRRSSPTPPPPRPPAVHAFPPSCPALPAGFHGFHGFPAPAAAAASRNPRPPPSGRGTVPGSRSASASA